MIIYAVVADVENQNQVMLKAGIIMRIEIAHSNETKSSR